MLVSAQVSIYPLRETRLSPSIETALAVFRERGLEVSPGAMSSIVSGDDEALFSAIREAFRKTSERGDLVMVVTLSNACPVDTGKADGRTRER
jgi:uncharacterized protein YqgV (UPF0045/DUF77 family)